MKKVILLSLLIAMVSVPFSQTKSYAGGDHKIPGATLHEIGEGLSHVLTFEPFNPPLKNHLWMKTDSDKMSFFHFAKATSMGENKLLFMGDAIKGKFCLEDQPDGGKTGFVHFHSTKKADGHKHGHGGEKGQDGYWLRHIAVGEFEAMGIKFSPGIAHNFKATPAPKCK